MTEEEMIAVNDAHEALRQQAYGMSPAEFAAETVKTQNTLLFIMLREMAAQVTFVNNRLDEYEAKLAGMFTPEGQAKAREMVMGLMTGGFGGGF